LESRYPQLDIRLIDQDREKCDKLARELERTIVLVGDGADEELLRREGVEGVDGFVATTANDERNILMGVIGKALGANKSIAVVRRGFFEKLDKYLPVDAMVNPNEALASVIMRYVLYPSAAGGLSIIERIDAEILEVTISKDSSALGVKISEIGFPKGALIALVYRRGQVFVPTGDTKLEDGDQVVLFASSDKMQQALDILGVKVS
jgi:trk system potassium uptake protein TrkA